LTTVSNQTNPRNVPVRPPWPELLCSRPTPAAAAGAHDLEGHAYATGRLPGLSGQPAVTILRFENLGATRHLTALDLHQRPSPAAPDYFAEFWQSLTALTRGLHACKVFLIKLTRFFWPCSYQAPERLATSGDVPSIFYCMTRTRFFSPLFHSRHLPHPVLFPLV